MTFILVNNLGKMLLYFSIVIVRKRDLGIEKDVQKKKGVSDDDTMKKTFLCKYADIYKPNKTAVTVNDQCNNTSNRVSYP